MIVEIFETYGCEITCTPFFVLINIRIYIYIYCINQLIDFVRHHEKF